MITLQSVIPNTFPPFFKEIEKDLYNVIEFNSTEDGGTEIISYGIGYKDNDQFKQMIGFFAQGNLDYYQKLIDLVE
jgi:predicted transcriptional regulator YdeE